MEKLSFRAEKGSRRGDAAIERKAAEVVL